MQQSHKTHFVARGSVLLTVCMLGACASAPREADVAEASRTEIAEAMERYQIALRTLDPDTMAAFFTPTAMLLEPGIAPIHTRDSIRAFLASFPGARVERATATPDVIEVFGNTGLLWGSYFERLHFPGQPVSEQHGMFVTEWVRQADGSWLIQRLWRIPVPEPADSSKRV